MVICAISKWLNAYFFYLDKCGILRIFSPNTLHESEVWYGEGNGRLCSQIILGKGVNLVSFIEMQMEEVQLWQ